jgi:outer membrane beta-barrel protein
MKNYFVIIVLLAFLLLPVSNVSGADTKDEAKVYAVQNRIFHRDHELKFDAGYIANEEFFHPFPVGFGYIYNLNEKYGWEVARAQYIIAPENDLKSKLESQFGVTPSEFAKPTFMIHSHLLYKPFYGKNAVLNKGVINHETYLFAGGGVVNYEWNYPEGSPQSSDSTGEMVPSASFGIGSKYFINEKFCLNFEIRDIMNFWSDGMENRIYVGVGIGFRFNLKPRKVEKDETFEKLNRYLKKENDDDI